MPSQAANYYKHSRAKEAAPSPPDFLKWTN